MNVTYHLTGYEIQTAIKKHVEEKVGAIPDGYEISISIKDNTGSEVYLHGLTIDALCAPKLPR